MSEQRKTVKVMFGMPNMGHTEPMAYDNRLVMMQHIGILQALSSNGLTEMDGVKYWYPENTKIEFYIATIGDVFPAYARETIAEMAVEENMDYLFFIDDDMLAPPDTFELLLKNDVDVCAALAFTRFPPHKPVLYNLEQGYDAIEHKPYYVNYSVFNYPKEKLVECDAVGFGAVLIKVSVLKGMKKKWFMTTSGAGEDIHFCHQARKQGYKVFMDTRVKLGHLGEPKIVTEETFETEQKANEYREKMGELNKYKSL